MIPDSAGILRACPQGPRSCRAGRWLPGALAALWMLGCGGGGGGASPSHLPPKTPVDKPRTPTTQALHIEAMYITQASQRLDGSIPLVQGRKGFLRVFVLAKSWSGPAPEVRARILDAAGNALLDRAMPGPVAGVPSVLDQATLGASWNLPVDGSLIQPGNQVEARVEAPAGVATGNLTFPADGSPQPMNVVAVPTLRITLIPVSSEGHVAQVTWGGRTTDSWLVRLKRDFPVAEVEAVEGPILGTSLVPGTSAEENVALLRRIQIMRWLVRGGEYRYFYGVFRNRPGVHFLGLGTRNPFPPDLGGRNAIGWDASGQIDGENYAEVLTHELGHNLGRMHAPCGDPPNVDPDYPYRDGHIGVAGFDVERGVPFDPSVYYDEMTYCSPRAVSDYTYEGVLRFRRAEPAAAGAARVTAPAQDCLIVSGSIRAGRVQWEPAFQLHRAPELPRPGRYLLSALDDKDLVLEQFPFEPEDVGDDGDGAATFSFVIPLAPAMRSRLHTLRITLDGAVLGDLHAAPLVRGSKADPRPHAARDAHGRVHLVWDPDAFSEALVRDPSGAVLGLGSGGKLELVTHAHTLECRFSDGLQTVVRQVPVVP